MYSNYEIAQAMLEIGRTNQRFGERFHRNWDVIEWAERHLSDAEQDMCTRLVEELV